MLKTLKVGESYLHTKEDSEFYLVNKLSLYSEAWKLGFRIQTRRIWKRNKYLGIRVTRLKPCKKHWKSWKFRMKVRDNGIISMKGGRSPKNEI